MSRLVDSYYNALYEQTHGKELYGTSSIAFLPEVMQSFLLYVSQDRIDLSNPVRILDYGCGRSILLDVFARAVNDNRAAIEELAVDKATLSATMQNISGSLSSFMGDFSRDQYAELVEWDGGIIEKHRFDPAISEYSTIPSGEYDFLICTDVFEHIPEFSHDANREPILKNVVSYVDSLSANPFLNISTRKAMQILPDGRNAHCTVKHPEEWQVILHDINSNLSPMFSRDFTSCHFIGKHATQAFDKVSYESYQRFGEVDLIAYPPQREMTTAKLASLKNIQPHKQKIRLQNIEWWKHIDPAAPVSP